MSRTAIPANATTALMRPSKVTATSHKAGSRLTSRNMFSGRLTTDCAVRSASRKASRKYTGPRKQMQHPSRRGATARLQQDDDRKDEADFESEAPVKLPEQRIGKRRQSDEQAHPHPQGKKGQEERGVLS